MTVLMSGINMYAMAVVMRVVLGWNINFSILVSSVTVAIYVALGGLRSAIFNEVLQFFLIWAGALLIPILGLMEAGGWSGLKAQDPAEPHGTACCQSRLLYPLVVDLGHFGYNPMGINWVGIVFGLGAVIAMGYWTTDFLVVQRVLAAKDLRSAELAPIIGAAFKMMVPFIVILPGLLGLALLRDPHRPSVAARPGDVAWSAAGQAQGLHGYDEVLPLMLARYCGPGLLGFGITALIAGFMSGMAGNVSAFTTVWTYDIYGALINKNASDESKVRMGRWCTVIGVVISIGTAYLVMQAQSIMDYVQALFSFFIAPLFGTVMLGMLWKRATPAGGLGTACRDSVFGRHVGLGESRSGRGAICGSFAGAQDQAQNMFRAFWCWLICVIVTVVVSYLTKPKPDSELKDLVYGLTPIPQKSMSPVHRPVFWGVVVAVVFVILKLFSGRERMKSGGSLSIWFFIGIVAGGERRRHLRARNLRIAVSAPPEHPVVLYNLHANIWWGACSSLVWFSVFTFLRRGNARGWLVILNCLLRKRRGTNMSTKKMTMGVIIGNRGFFPDQLAKSGREEMMQALDKAGMDASFSARKTANMARWRPTKKPSAARRCSARTATGSTA